eukprot:2175354-Karenia_brevis.AAC.1
MEHKKQFGKSLQRMLKTLGAVRRSLYRHAAREVAGRGPKSQGQGRPSHRCKAEDAESCSWPTRTDFGE